MTMRTGDTVTDVTGGLYVRLSAFTAAGPSPRSVH